MCVSRISTFLALGFVLACGPNEAFVDELALDEDAALAEQGLGVLRVNECRAGTGGYVELVNTSAATVDLAQASGTCWFVDDDVGGAAPVQLTDTNVRHAPGATWCAAAGRRSTCALVGPGERVWVNYGGLNAGSLDICRLLSARVTSGACGAQVNEQAGGFTRGTGCYGRIPDTTGAWFPTAIECSPEGAKNGGGLPGLKIVINEFKPGTGGFVELFNGSTTDRIDVSGWLIDDIANGGAAPKAIAAGTVLLPRRRHVVPYAGVNVASADEVRLLHASGLVIDARSNGYAGASLTGQCFGRSPDGEAWQAAPMACTPGDTNQAAPCPGGTYGGVTFTAAQECAAIRFLNNAPSSAISRVLQGGNIALDCGPGGTCGTTRQRAWTRLDQLLAYRNVVSCGEGGTTALTWLRNEALTLDTAAPASDTVASLWAQREQLGTRIVTLEVVVTATAAGSNGRVCGVIRDTPSSSGWLTACPYVSPYADGPSSSFSGWVGKRVWLRGRVRHDQYVPGGGRWILEQLEPRQTGPASTQCGLGTWRALVE